MAKYRYLWMACFCVAVAHVRGPAAPWPAKPYRALVVVDTWSDPASVVVLHDKDAFQPVAALLKAWSVPFDIFRLDQEHFDDSYLLDRSGNARYGIIVWLADSTPLTDLESPLRDAVQAGTSFLVVGARPQGPAIEKLLALKFRDVYSATDPLRLVKSHFITREVAALKMDNLSEANNFTDRRWVEPQGAEVLIDQAQHPILTVAHPQAETPAIWLGANELTLLRDSPYWRSLFFRSLVYGLGYAVLPNVDYSHSVEIEMDDWGTSDKGYLSYWRYKTPDEDTLRQHLIAPLKKHNAVASANVNTGYVDRKTGRILSPWEQKFTDLYGVQQDYGSTRRGLKAALEAGVLEIQSHGWTHMQPDLDSPPGPWWTASLQGEASAGDWYTEFRDERRDKEIPALVQLFHMQRSLECLRADFSQTPLELRPGGSGWSKSLLNRTGRLAGLVGFGIFHAEPDFIEFMDGNLVLDMTGIGFQTVIAYDRPFRFELWPPHPDGPVMVLFHDRDIAFEPGFLERFLEALPPGYKVASTNWYVGVLHTQIESSGGQGWQLSFNFDPHYGAYFGKHASSWRLWLSDPLRERLGATPELNISVDDQAPRRVRAADLLGETITIDIPAGVGAHVWKLIAAH